MAKKKLVENEAASQPGQITVVVTGKTKAGSGEVRIDTSLEFYLDAPDATTPEECAAAAGRFMANEVKLHGVSAYDDEFSQPMKFIHSDGETDGETFSLGPDYLNMAVQAIMTGFGFAIGMAIILLIAKVI